MLMSGGYLALGLQKSFSESIAPCENLPPFLWCLFIINAWKSILSCGHFHSGGRVAVMHLWNDLFVSVTFVHIKASLQSCSAHSEEGSVSGVKGENSKIFRLNFTWPFVCSCNVIYLVLSILRQAFRIKCQWICKVKNFTTQFLSLQVSKCITKFGSRREREGKNLLRWRHGDKTFYGDLLSGAFWFGGPWESLGTRQRMSMKLLYNQVPNAFWCSKYFKLILVIIFHPFSCTVLNHLSPDSHQVAGHYPKSYQNPFEQIEE